MYNLISPVKPNDKSFKELVEVMKRHLSIFLRDCMYRTKLNLSTHQDGESVVVYVSELRTIAQYCNCGGTLEVMLRDRIVCGINDQQTQKKLLAEKELSFK